MTGLLLRVAMLALLLLAALNDDQIVSMLFADPAPGMVTPISTALQCLAWLAGALVVISALELFVWRGIVARIARHPVPSLLKSVIALVVLVVALTCIVAFVFRRDVTAIWATSGVIGLVLGFALRNMIQDVFTGIALNLDGAIREGDWISLHHRDFRQEQYGRMLDIGWRVARVQLENNNVIVVPNSMLGMMAVTNFAHSDHVTRLETGIVIDFDVPPERARRILLAGAMAAASEKGILDHPEPTVLIGEPEEYGARYKVRFWGKVDERSPSILCDAVMAHLLRQLRIAGLTPAMPKEDVFLERRPRRLLDHGGESDRLEILSRIDLFAGVLRHGELAELARDAAIRRFDPDTVLVRQGEAGTSLFVVAEGLLDVHVDGAGGTPLKVGHILVGEVFGEMSLLTGAPRSATVSSVTGVIAYEISRDLFETILEARPDMADEISRIVARRQAAIAGASERPAAEIESDERLLRKRIREGMAKVFAGIARKNRTQSHQPAMEA